MFLDGFDLESIQLDARGFDCVSARHSVLGELSGSEELASQSVGLVPGDSLELEFVPASSANDGEDCFFIAERSGEAGGLAGRPDEHGDEPVAPPEFSLGPSMPDGDAVRIAFSLASDAHARLEIFDVSGRRLTTLVDRDLLAGPHEARWDRTFASGSRARSGVYFYRLVAGADHARRTMVVAP
jgi:hypothetical protein